MRIASLLPVALCCCGTSHAAPERVDAGQAPVGVHVVPPAQVVDAAAPVARSRHVLVIGDSEACAVKPYIKKAAAEACNGLGVPTDVIDVDCKGGTTVQYWGAQGHFRGSLEGHGRPDAVVVFLGTNHYWQTTAPPVETITSLLPDSSDCVWVGNTAVKGKRWRINSLMRDAVSPRCTYFDTEAANIELPDGVHPSGAAAIRWVKAIWPLIPPRYETGT